MSNNEMRVKAGDQPFDFTAVDMYGRTTRLSDHRSGKVMLSFFRNTLCPFCNLHVHALLDRESYYLSKKMKMIIFFQSSREEVMKNSNLRSIKNPSIIIPDPEMVVYKKFGIERSWAKVMGAYASRDTFKKLGQAMTTKDVAVGYSTKNENSIVPADFLIKDFSVTRAHYGKHIADHLPLAEIDKFVNS